MGNFSPDKWHFAIGSLDWQISNYRDKNFPFPWHYQLRQSKRKHTCQPANNSSAVSNIVLLRNSTLRWQNLYPFPDASSKKYTPEAILDMVKIAAQESEENTEVISLWLSCRVTDRFSYTFGTSGLKKVFFFAGP